MSAPTETARESFIRYHLPEIESCHVKLAGLTGADLKAAARAIAIDWFDYACQVSEDATARMYSDNFVYDNYELMERTSWPISADG